MGPCRTGCQQRPGHVAGPPASAVDASVRASAPGRHQRAASASGALPLGDGMQPRCLVLWQHLGQGAPSHGPWPCRNSTSPLIICKNAAPSPCWSTWRWWISKGPSLGGFGQPHLLHGSGRWGAHGSCRLVLRLLSNAIQDLAQVRGNADHSPAPRSCSRSPASLLIFFFISASRSFRWST
jgi:hypothetical protein